MTNIEKLLNIYYKRDGRNLTATPKRHRMEHTTNDYDKAIKQEAQRKHRHLILKELLNEAPFTITKDNEKQIQYWIDTFNTTFNEFHKQASNETIILAFIMMQYKKENPKRQIDEYAITKKYNLTPKVFLLIQNRMIFKLMKATPMTYNQRRYHESGHYF